jgi:uncharacterized protein YjaG (DUF416 family)
MYQFICYSNIFIVYNVYPAIITFAVQQIYNYGHLVPDSCNVPVYNVYPAIITFAVQQIYSYGHLVPDS